MSASRWRTAGTEIAGSIPPSGSILRALVMIHVAEDAQRESGAGGARARTQQISLGLTSSCDFLSFMGEKMTLLFSTSTLSSSRKREVVTFLPCFFFSSLPRVDCTVKKKKGSRNSSFFWFGNEERSGDFVVLTRPDGSVPLNRTGAAESSRAERPAL